MTRLNGASSTRRPRNWKSCSRREKRCRCVRRRWSPRTAATAATATGAGVTSTVLPTANVTVTSHPGNSISSNYHVDFAALDSNHDGNLSHGEVNASGNADLIREFVAVDINRNGRLSKDEMKGWTD